ncbi:MAG: Maf family protein [Chitinophagales bacterium]
MKLNIPYQLVLASKSPRRQMLLRQLGWNFDIITQETDESYPPHLAIADVPTYIASQKAKAVLPQIAKNQLIIAADTIVALDNIVFGKPKDAKDAFRILQQLSGKKHQVITGVCLKTHDIEHCFSNTTDVFFRHLSEQQMRFYIQKFEPYDKAGAYAIQEWIGMVGIEKINGCYFNVVGLPLSHLHKEINIFC